MSIRILLVDDHQIVLKGISFFLNMQPDFELVGEANNGAEAVEKASELQPDLILMDLSMPVMDGLEASQLIAKQNPAIKIVVLTSFSDPSHIVPALQLGVVGYILKDVEPDQLAEAIRSAYKGNVQLHPDIAKALLEQTVPQSAAPSVDAVASIATTSAQSSIAGSEALRTLTPRETEVLKLLTRGMSNKDIANALIVAEKTVKTHVSSILSKLHLTDRTQAALYAIQFHHWTDEG